MGGTLYKTPEGERMLKQLYDRQVEQLGMGHEDLYVATRFGTTHMLKLGNPKGEPVLLFHGGNSTAPHTLLQSRFLMKDHMVYAPDIIGHPGKSHQRQLSSNTLAYGQWASGVIDALGYPSMNCMGGSFGGGILAKLMCVSPEKIRKAVLVVPSGISNASKSKLIVSMGLPMMMYLATKQEKWFKRAFSPMAIPGEPVDDHTLEMIRFAFHHVKVNPNMPSNVKKIDMAQYKSPTLLLAGEKDVLFPGEKVIKRAKELIPHEEAHLLENCGHLYYSSDERLQQMGKIIKEFLANEPKRS